jgi:hypothetical protein
MVQGASITVGNLDAERLPAIAFCIIVGGRRVADNSGLAAGELVAPVGEKALLASDRLRASVAHKAAADPRGATCPCDTSKVLGFRTLNKD